MSASLFYVNIGKRQLFYTGLFGRASSAKAPGTKFTIDS